MTVSFAVIRWALDQEPKGADEVGPVVVKFILVALANFARTDGRAWPGQEKLEQITGAGERTIRRGLQALEEQGLIEDTGTRVGKTGRTVVWRLNPASPTGFNAARLSGNPARLSSNPARVAGSSKDDPVTEPITEPGELRRNVKPPPPPGPGHEPAAGPLKDRLDRLRQMAAKASKGVD